MSAEQTVDEQREALREIRKGRRQALAMFVKSLGFDPDHVRSITAIDGSIRLTMFAEDKSGPADAPYEPAMVVDQNGKSVKAIYEVNLLTTNTDLDEDAFIDNLISGRPIE